MANDRNASSAILGYSYQFLHTIKDILESDSSAQFTIEGIEDLDVVRSTERELIQYKYHDKKKLTNSLLAKPITLMFNHFVQSSSKTFIYKLFVKGQQNNFEISVENFKKMFSLAAATNYKLGDEKSRYYQDDEKIQSFIAKFELREVMDFDTLQNLVVQLICKKLNVSEPESRFQIYPYAYKWINDKSRKMAEEQRKTSTGTFISELTIAKKRYDFSLLQRLKGEQELITVLRKSLQNLSIKKNNSTHIFVMNGQRNSNIAEFIINLSKKFIFPGENADTQVPVFIVEDMDGLKRRILEISKQEKLGLVFNDGYEDYIFDSNIFNQGLLIKKSASGKKIMDSSFNFKLISKEKYVKERHNIKLEKSSYFFINERLDIENATNTFILDNIEFHNILSIF